MYLVITPDEKIGSVGHTISAAGACLAVFCAIYGPGFRAMLESRPGAWLGKRSFSLYLIQEPTIAAIAIALTVPYGPAATVAVALPVTLVLGTWFYRFVEGPSHRLSQRAGTAVRTVLDRRRQRTVGSAV
jgi:peptidoglycan/LPS O-acetylase OafA/YrhL